VELQRELLESSRVCKNTVRITDQGKADLAIAVEEAAAPMVPDAAPEELAIWARGLGPVSPEPEGAVVLPPLRSHGFGGLDIAGDLFLCPQAPAAVSKD